MAQSGCSNRIRTDVNLAASLIFVAQAAYGAAAEIPDDLAGELLVEPVLKRHEYIEVHESLEDQHRRNGQAFGETLDCYAIVDRDFMLGSLEHA
jgi:hypothetical protein